MTAGMAVFDTMRHVRPDCSTVCVGLAASMGAFLLASGQKVCREVHTYMLGARRWCACQTSGYKHVCSWTVMSGHCDIVADFGFLDNMGYACCRASATRWQTRGS